MDPINIEVMLLNWSETANGGAKVVLQLADPDDLERFKAMTLAKGKRAGQRLGCAFVEIGDDEKPVEHKRSGAGPLCTLAARWCKDEKFQQWLEEQRNLTWVNSEAPVEDREATAADCVRLICSVASRRDLDTNPNAGRSFHKLVREPFAAWLDQQEL